MQVETISEQLLFSTVRVVATTSTGRSTGTAFVYHYKTEQHDILFLVTNRHVIEGAHTGYLIFTEGHGNQPIIGKKIDLILEHMQQAWHVHPDATIDIAIMPLVPVLQALNKQVFFRSIPHGIAATAHELADLDAIEEIVFIGYPNGMFDSHNLTPIVRKGITATHPQLDYEGKPLFLIDASVFPGSSGSPVFLVNSGGYSKRGQYYLGASRIMFLGVVTQVAIREEHGRIEYLTSPTSLQPVVKTRHMINLGFVFKPIAIAQAIEHFLTVLSSMQSQ